jgi:hypothetical protein
MRSFFLNLLLFVLTLAGGTDAFPFEFEQIKSLARSIETRFPPSDYVYIGIGRSPTALIAYFQETRPQMAFNIPLSLTGSINEGFNANELTALYTHLDRFMPSQAQIAGRKILLIDYVLSGRSLSLIPNFLSGYQQSRGFKNAIAVVGLVDSDTRQHQIEELEARISGSVRLQLLPLTSSLSRDFRNRRFGFYSEFGRYEVNHWDTQLYSNFISSPIYQLFRQVLRLRMNYESANNQHDYMRGKDAQELFSKITSRFLEILSNPANQMPLIRLSRLLPETLGLELFKQLMQHWWNRLPEKHPALLIEELEELLADYPHWFWSTYEDITEPIKVSQTILNMSSEQLSPYDLEDRADLVLRTFKAHQCESSLRTQRL